MSTVLRKKPLIGSSSDEGSPFLPGSSEFPDCPREVMLILPAWYDLRAVGPLGILINRKSISTGRPQDEGDDDRSCAR